MNDDPPASPAERRLEEHLAVLREDKPQPGKALSTHVVHRARWQMLLRVPLRVVGMVAGALLDGLAALTGARRAPR
jgi:hypothetical protein